MQPAAAAAARGPCSPLRVTAPRPGDLPLLSLSLFFSLSRLLSLCGSLSLSFSLILRDSHPAHDDAAVVRHFLRFDIQFCMTGR